MSWNPTDINTQKSCLSQSEISAYLEKSLSKQERFEVENHMLGCALCQDAMEGYILYPKELDHKALNKNDSIKTWLSIAAMLCMIIVGGFAVYKYKFANNSENVFAQYYQKPSWDNQTRGNNISSSYKEAIQNYNLGFYQAAVLSFDSLLIQKEDDNQLRLYKGIAHLEMDEFEKAEEELSTVRINSDIFFEEASWYLALVHIKTDNIVEAEVFLNEIIKLENSFFYDKAIEMNSRLQK